MSDRDYLSAIGRLVEKEFRGALIYDALILQAALKKKAAGDEIAIREPS